MMGAASTVAENAIYNLVSCAWVEPNIAYLPSWAAPDVAPTAPVTTGDRFRPRDASPPDGLLHCVCVQQMCTGSVRVER
jgi:hypothetical protein